MARHQRLAIPLWMMTYFGYQLLECVEQATEASPEDCRRHLSYMAKALRIMGVPFSDDRERMIAFARDAEVLENDGEELLSQFSDPIAGEMLTRRDMIAAPPDIRMREVLEIRHTACSPVALVEDGRLVGVVGDDEIYRGILRQSALGEEAGEEDPTS